MNGEVERFNRNIKKRVQIAYVENVDYRIALFDYLLVYHNSKYSATGTTPAHLMFGHELRDSIPGIIKHSPNILYEDIIVEYDAKKKSVIEKENLKRKARVDDIDIGNTEVTKNHGVKPGYVPRFDPKKFKVANKERSKCTLVSQEDSKTLVRDTSHVKKVPFEQSKYVNVQNEGEKDDNSSRTTRQGRAVEAPMRFNDYVYRIEQM